MTSNEPIRKEAEPSAHDALLCFRNVYNRIPGPSIGTTAATNASKAIRDIIANPESTLGSVVTDIRVKLLLVAQPLTPSAARKNLALTTTRDGDFHEALTNSRS